MSKGNFHKKDTGEKYPCPMSRRRFLKAGGATLASVGVPFFFGSCNSIICGDLDPIPGYRPKVSSAWIEKGQHKHSYELFRDTVEAATDFSWLSSHDTVLLKLALNSGNSYPFTTDPIQLSFIIDLLKSKKPDCRIIIGDESSIAYTFMTTSRQLFQQSGLSEAIAGKDVELSFFDEGEYKETFPGAAENSQYSSHWVNPPKITRLVDEVDHIIYLPRVANHMMAGETFGFKLAVGFLAPDTRSIDLHGLFSNINLHQKYQEINHIPEIENKFRLAISSGTKMVTTAGPDFGTIVEPEAGLIFASDDILANDLLAGAWLEANRGMDGSVDLYCKPANRNALERKQQNGTVESLVWEQLNSNNNCAITSYMNSLLERRLDHL